MPLTHEEIQRLDWKVILRPYWAIGWRVFLISMAAIFVATLITKAVNSDAVAALAFLTALVVVLVFTIEMFRKVFTKSFRDFRITLLATINDEEITPSFYMGLCLWWSSSWRSVLFSAVLNAAMILAGIDLNSLTADIIEILFSIPAGFIIFKIVLQKRYKEFRVAVIPHEQTAEASA